MMKSRTEMPGPPHGTEIRVHDWKTVLIGLSSSGRDETLRKYRQPEVGYRETRAHFCVALRQDLIRYLKGKYPVVQDCGSKDIIPHEIQNLTLPVSEVAQRVALSEPETHHHGPTIGAAQAFTDLLTSIKYEDWDLHLGELQTLRGNPAYGASVGSKILAALADPILGELPLYQVNKEPVTLTQSEESQGFFEGLPTEMKMQSDGTWIGYRYVLYPDSLVNTEVYLDPKSREPLSIYLMKKVDSTEASKHLLQEGDLAKFEAEIRKTMEDHDLLQLALSLRNGGTRNTGPRDVERAKVLLERLEDRGIARARHELTLINQGGTVIQEQSQEELQDEPPPPDYWTVLAESESIL